MLSAANPLQPSAERTETWTILTPQLWSRPVLSSRSCPILFITARQHARRNDIQGKDDCRKFSPQPHCTGICHARCDSIAIRSRCAKDIRRTGSGMALEWRSSGISRPSGGKLFSFGNTARRSDTAHSHPLLQVKRCHAAARNDQKCISGMQRIQPERLSD